MTGLHLSPEEREARRKQVADLMDSGMKQSDVSRQLGLAQSAVSRWWRITLKMREFGPSTWGEAERVVYGVLARHRVGTVADALETEITGALRKAGLLDREVRGEEVTEGAGPDDQCGCGDPVTWYGGEWMHIYSEKLRGTDDHTAGPETGYYEPGG